MSEQTHAQVYLPADGEDTAAFAARIATAFVEHVAQIDEAPVGGGDPFSDFGDVSF